MPPSYNTPPSYTIISGSALVAAACGVQQLQNKTTPREQTIYAFDVLQSDAAPGLAGSEDGGSSSSGGLPRLENRRTFAVTQSVKPDGIKVDSDGNGVCGLVFDSLITSRTLGASCWEPLPAYYYAGRLDCLSHSLSSYCIIQ
jgi:hypothetical protein